MDIRQSEVRQALRWTISASFAIAFLLISGVLGARLEPDISIYIGGDGSRWWYPSPLGRAVGLLGLPAFYAVGFVGAAALGYLLSRSWRSLAIFGAGGLVGWYVFVLGLDGSGASLVALGLLGVPVAYFYAAFLHPASVLGHVAHWPGILFWIVLLIAFLLTPYRGILSDFPSLTDWAAGALTSLSIVGAIALRRMWGGTRGGLCTSYCVAGGVLAALQGHVQIRYMLPALVVCACTVRND